MEKPNKPALRRLETMDVKKSSSSLNMSTSSLRSNNDDGREIISTTTTAHAAGRRPATVRFAPTPATPPPPSSSSTTTARRTSSSRTVQSQQKAGASRPATARPASVSGPRARPSAGRSLHVGSPELRGPKAMRRSWGWGTAGGGGGNAEEKESGDGHAGRAAMVEVKPKAQTRSSSIPRKMSAEEKPPQQKGENKLKATSTMTQANSDSPTKAEVSMESSPRSTAPASKDSEKGPSSVSLNSTVARASPPPPPPRKTTPTAMGASWESLPSDLQSIGLEVMSYRDAAEVAAVEALQEASSAEILLRGLSAFADLAAVAAEQSPQQTVDEFLALQATLARSAVAPGDGSHAEDWLRAAVSADLATFSLYSAPSTQQPANAAGREPTAAVPSTWLRAAAGELREETCAWFLGHVERLIDADAAGTLGQLKRVNDWLEDAAAAAAAGLRSDAAGVERLRKKIFGYLLDHVESAVVALNGGVGPGRRR